jgi:hypothetical protein
MKNGFAIAYINTFSCKIFFPSLNCNLCTVSPRCAFFWRRGIRLDIDRLLNGIEFATVFVLLFVCPVGPDK